MKEAMQTIDLLAEQHIRESESHLRHIDELMAKASQSAADKTSDPEVQTLLSQVSETRARLGRDLEDLRRGFVDGSNQATVERGKGLKTALNELGTQFERALTAILDTRGL
ncbi:hypothetical protein WKW77_24950 [Variovorax ureilyticus]|uniref:Uncharacterized protein n=1 Tax=Variovorax ureilyticus TaxID=1836198 RepID=A0ABU8VMG6_9BURK